MRPCHPTSSSVASNARRPAPDGRASPRASAGPAAHRALLTKARPTTSPRSPVARRPDPPELDGHPPAPHAGPVLAAGGMHGGVSAMSVTGQTDRFAFDPPTDLFDPFAPGVMDDPYPYYAALRERDPVHHNPRLGMYFLSRHEDVRRADRDP